MERSLSTWHVPPSSIMPFEVRCPVAGRDVPDLVVALRQVDCFNGLHSVVTGIYDIGLCCATCYPIGPAEAAQRIGCLDPLVKVRTAGVQFLHAVVATVRHVHVTTGVNVNVPGGS